MGQKCSSLMTDDGSDINHCIEQVLSGTIPLLMLLLAAATTLPRKSKRARQDGTYALLSVNEGGDLLTESVAPLEEEGEVRALDEYTNVDFARQSLAFLLLLLPPCALLVRFSSPRHADPEWFECYFAAAAALSALLTLLLVHGGAAAAAAAGGGPGGRPHAAVPAAAAWAVQCLLLGAALFSALRGAAPGSFASAALYLHFGLAAALLAALALFDAPLPRRGRGGGKRRGGGGGGGGLKEPLLEEEEEGGGGAKLLPEPYAGLFTLLTFSWLNPVMATGYARPLEERDLYALHPAERAPALNGRLRRAWAAERARAPHGPSFARALRAAFGPTFYAAVFFKFLYDSLMFVGPQLLNRLIAFLDSQEGADPQPAWRGFAYVALLFCSAVAQSCVLHQYFHRCYRTGMRLKSAIITIVYQKALRIKPGQTSLKSEKDKQKEREAEAKAAAEGGAAGRGQEEKGAGGGEEDKPGESDKASTGEVVNLMSVDAQRLQDLMSYFAILVSAPYQILLSLIFLWFQLGPSVFAGVGVMVLMVPISAAVARRSKKLQRKLMKVKDERIKVTNEVLGGMSILKLYAWERSFKAKVDGLRDRELEHLRAYLLVNCVSRVMWTIVPVLVSLATFATYVLLGHELAAAQAFTAIALFNILRFPLAFFPIMISNAMEASLSVDRLSRFLQLPEVPVLPAAEATVAGGLPPGVSCAGADLAWDDGAPLLRGLTLEVPMGALACVIGATGAGKSGLLQALIGDLRPAAGALAVRGRVGYTSQVAWIQNATLRDNVLFGAPHDPDWYRAVLEACALLPDLDQLPSGDQTEIGERGINLSGGQKQRVALARAVYQRADVYLLDDPLSAVDSHVAAHIFERCVRGLLRASAVVLVTHNLRALPAADQILLLEDKRVAFAGNYEALTRSGLPFADVLHAEEEEEEEEEEGAEGKAADGGGADALGPPAPPSAARALSAQPRAASSRRLSSRQKSLRRDQEVERQQSAQKKREGLLIEKETVAKGGVARAIYLEYVRGCGGYGLFLAGVLTLLLNQGSQVGGNSWLSYWSDDNGVAPALGLGVYAALALAAALAALLCLVRFSLSGLNAARHFHQAMLASLLRAPMAFYDTTPLGRVLNRFSKDTYTIDEVLMTSIYSYLSTLVGVLSTVAVIGYVTPYFLLAMVPPAALYYATQQYYVASSRELKRLDSVSRSPVFSHFGETLEGAAVVRAFRRQGDFVRENEAKLDRNLQAYFVNISSNRWLAMRLEFVGTCIVSLAACFSVVGRGGVSAGLGGLSITYALGITQTLNWMVRMTSDTETNIVAVERVQEYITDVTPEAPAIVEPRPDADWPPHGRIQLEKVSLRYRPGLPLVLRSIDLDIAAGEKVGVVGRTGAGKSSLLKALLRLVEPCAGRVLVDGVDIGAMGLEDLRSRFAIIPQDPVLFTGTVRFNLDPFVDHPDDQVWEALRRAHLADHIKSLQGGLDHQVEEAGRNFSMGERQLLCLARALLRRSRVLLLDEATSAVDHRTDALIQGTLRSEFQGSTVLTVAHRVDTIADYDRVLVLAEGRIAENAPPQELLKDPRTEFYKIWDAHQKGMSV